MKFKYIFLICNVFYFAHGGSAMPTVFQVMNFIDHFVMASKFGTILSPFLLQSYKNILLWIIPEANHP